MGVGYIAPVRTVWQSVRERRRWGSAPTYVDIRKGGIRTPRSSTYSIALRASSVPHRRWAFICHQ